jgi:tetratricopeptide (TPR) repeat protein
MKRFPFAVFSALLLSIPRFAVGDDPGPGHGVVIGASQYLSAGADAIRDGRYDEGIRLTKIGLQRDTRSLRDRAAGLANLCAAYVATERPDEAIPHCTQSIELFAGNWRAYSNRSHAYVQKEMYAEAALDNAAAAALSPNAAHVTMIRAMLNERRLTPKITMQEHR